MRLGGSSQRIAMLDVEPDGALAQRLEGALGDLGQHRALGGVVEQDRAREGRGFLVDAVDRQPIDRSARLPIADPVAAHRERVEVLARRGLAETVVDHVGAAAAGGVVHRRGEAVVAADDDGVAARGTRGARLGVGGDGADHPGAQRLGPLAQQQPDAARRRVDEDGLAGPHAVGAMQQVFGGHALQHQRRRRLVVDLVRQHHDLVRRQGADADIGARRRAGIGDAVARQQMGDAVADIQDHAGRFHADAARAARSAGTRPCAHRRRCS